MRPSKTIQGHWNLSQAELGADYRGVETMRIEIKHGDCMEVFAEIKEDSVGSVICDPPYG